MFFFQQLPFFKTDKLKIYRIREYLEGLKI